MKSASDESYGTLDLSLKLKEKFLTKEVLNYVGDIDYLLVDWHSIERIEYGSLANDKVLFATDMYISTMETTKSEGFDSYDEDIPYWHYTDSHCSFYGDFTSSQATNFFISGKCTELGLCGGFFFLCEICLLHQYGLHRTKDRINETCRNVSFPVFLSLFSVVPNLKAYSKYCTFIFCFGSTKYKSLFKILSYFQTTKGL